MREVGHLLCDKVWLTAAVTFPPKAVGWDWFKASVQVSQVLPHETQKPHYGLGLVHRGQSLPELFPQSWKHVTV